MPVPAATAESLPVAKSGEWICGQARSKEGHNEDQERDSECSGWGLHIRTFGRLSAQRTMPVRGGQQWEQVHERQHELQT